MASSFERRYPNIAYWVSSHGWIELGRDHYRPSLVRALDEGGMVWEGRAHYETIDEAFEALESALAEWMAGGEDLPQPRGVSEAGNG